MTTHITGYRNGEPWPPAGGTVDLPDHEAADLIAAGYAEADTPGDIPARGDGGELLDQEAHHAPTPEPGPDAAADSDEATAEDRNGTPASRPKRPRKSPARR
jgi:hypothetical protein